MYVRVYVDDLLIVFDKTKTKAETIQKTTNNFDHNLTFKAEIEENNTIRYLDLNMNKKDNQINLNIH
jgi:Fe-S cluster assembly scaffold protein SufB